MGNVEIREIPIRQWVATQPRYEQLANHLQRYNTVPDNTANEYQGLILTKNKLSIGNHVLCERRLLGNKIVVETYLNPNYMQTKNGKQQPKQGCEWLDQLRIAMQKKMLQANASQVKEKVDNYIANNSDESIKIAEYKVKKACQLARSVIRLYDEILSKVENKELLNESEVGRLALDMTKYCFTTLELNKHEHLAMFQEFKSGLNSFLKDAANVDSEQHEQWMKTNYKLLPFVQFRDTVLGQFGSWVALSQKVTSEETEIIAIHSLKYCDCVLMFKRYQLEINQYGMLSHPEWLDSTLNQWGIQRDNIIGYIGIRYPNSKVEQIGIVHKKSVKNKADQSSRKVLWYTELERYQHKQVQTVCDTNNMEYQVKDKLVFDGHILKKTQVLVTVPKKVLVSDVQSTKIEVDPEIAMFLSLYGVAHNQAIKPSKLVTINETSKHINVNWQSLTGLNVAPMNKAGQIRWHPKDSCPFTVID